MAQKVASLNSLNSKIMTTGATTADRDIDTDGRATHDGQTHANATDGQADTQTTQTATAKAATAAVTAAQQQQQCPQPPQQRLSDMLALPD